MVNKKKRGRPNKSNGNNRHNLALNEIEDLVKKNPREEKKHKKNKKYVKNNHADKLDKFTKIAFKLFIFSIILPILKYFNVAIVKDWSWWVTVVPFWGSLSIGLIVIFAVSLWKSK